MSAIAALTGVCAALALPQAAAAQGAYQPFSYWDGQNPFNCQNQDVGTGTDYPDPDADPFCVEFDKTSQNVTDFGIADFFAQEPDRVAAAAGKCFYFQRDHWTGSIVQGSDPELWNWDGSYFFDKAKGIGGAHMSNLRVGGVPQDGSPYAPPQYQPYFAEGGGGGAIFLLESGPDPTCRAKVDTPEEREGIYLTEPVFKRCISPGGQIRGRRIGRVALGHSRERVWDRLGPPQRRKTYFHRWCVTGGSSLRVGYHKRNRGERAARGGAPRAVSLIRTTNPGHDVRGIGPGSKRGQAQRRLGLRPAFRVGRTEVMSATPHRRHQLLAGLRGPRVRWLAIVDPNRLPAPARLRNALGNAR